VTVALLVVGFLMFWAGSALLIDAWERRRQRPPLCERLAPYFPTIADEAELWLRRHDPN